MRFGHWMWRGVLRDEAAGDPAGSGTATTPPPVVDAAALQARIAQLERDHQSARAAAEASEENARYWHDRAKATTAAPAPAAATETEDDSVDPIEVLSKEGRKGLKKLLAKEGLVSAEDVEKIVAQRVSQTTTTIQEEQRLYGEYPELKDRQSEFFKETKRVYQELLATDVPAVQAMGLAAKQVELEQIKAGTRLTAAQKEERQRRADAQSGDRSRTRGGATAADDPGDEELDSLQMQICRDMEISPEQYKKRVKEHYSGKPRKAA